MKMQNVHIISLLMLFLLEGCRTIDRDKSPISSPSSESAAQPTKPSEDDEGIPGYFHKFDGILVERLEAGPMETHKYRITIPAQNFSSLREGEKFSVRITTPIVVKDMRIDEDDKTYFMATSGMIFEPIYDPAKSVVLEHPQVPAGAPFAIELYPSTTDIEKKRILVREASEIKPSTFYVFQDDAVTVGKEFTRPHLQKDFHGAFD